MAEEVQIQGSGERGKVRHPLGIIGLMLITFGIYYWVWYYKVNKEMAEMGKVRNTEELGTSPGTSLLATTLGVFLIVPPYVSLYKSSKRLQASERLIGVPAGMEPGLLFLLLILIGPVGIYIFQSNLNKVLQQQAQGAGQPPPLQAPEAPQPATPPVAEQPQR
jgi:Domain of unknown function (DUF4234)